MVDKIEVKEIKFKKIFEEIISLTMKPKDKSDQIMKLRVSYENGVIQTNFLSL